MDDDVILDFSSSDNVATERPHEWSRRPDCDEFVGSKRSKHSLVAYRGALYAFGGDNGQKMLNDLLRYNVSDSSWCRACTTGQVPAPRYHHSSVVYGNSMYVFGGYTGDIHSNCNLMNRNDLYEYNFLTCCWSEWKFTTLASPRPVPRSAHGAAAYDGKLWIYGGYDGNNRLNDMWTTSLKDSSSARWEEVDQGGDRPPTCCNFALCVARGSMFVFSGQSGTRVTNDLFRFDFESLIWSRISTIDNILRGVGTPPSRRYGHTMVSHGRSLYVFGGAVPDSPLQPDLFAFDLDACSWRVVQPAMESDIPSERLFHAAAVLDGAMYIYGGATIGSTAAVDKKDRTNQVYRFQLTEIPACTLRADLTRLLMGQVYKPDLMFLLRHPDSGEKVTIPAHRAVVASRSPYFRSQLMQLLSVGGHQEDPTTPLEIDLATVSNANIGPVAFDIVLRAMYTDEVDWRRLVSPDDSDAPLSTSLVLVMMDVYHLAVRFGLSKLELIAEQYLNAAITVGNVLTALRTAAERNLTFIKEVCLRFIVKESNYSLVVMSAAFESLPPPLMVEIVRRKLGGHSQPPLHHVHHRARHVNFCAGGEGSLERDLEVFLATEEADRLADVTLVVGPDAQQVRIPAHRSILTARSSYFEALFRSFAPRDHSVSLRILHLVPTLYATRVLLRYIYANAVAMPDNMRGGRAAMLGGDDVMTPQEALYLLRAASFFGFTNSRLTSACKTTLERNIDSNNVIQVLAAADEIQLSEAAETGDEVETDLAIVSVKRHALSLVTKDFVSICKSAHFRTLPRHLLLEIMDRVADRMAASCCTQHILHPQIATPSRKRSTSSTRMPALAAIDISPPPSSALLNISGESSGNSTSNAGRRPSGSTSPQVLIHNVGSSANLQLNNLNQDPRPDPAHVLTTSSGPSRLQHPSPSSSDNGGQIEFYRKI